VVSLAGAGDGLTPDDLYVIGQIPTRDGDADRRDRSDRHTAIGFEQTS
jgi:hypothetical protein